MVDVPYRFSPRSYQEPLFIARERGVRFFDLCWHRRSGKDKTLLNLMIREMCGRVGNYLYLLPTAVGARRNVWEAVGADGLRWTDHFPPELIDAKRDDQLFIRLKNGSTFQLAGSDDPDALRGSNPLGVIFSEYALCRESAWDTVRPILAENGGWAAFCYTPKGTNHAHKLHTVALASPQAWFSSLKTVDQTYRDGLGESKRPVVELDEIERDRREGVDEDFIQQEYWCSFSGYMVGSYYSALMAKAHDEGRILDLPWRSELPVETAWDIGIGDSTAIWIFQRQGGWLHFIDFIEDSGEGLASYIRALRERPYVYGTHWGPHDLAVREFSSGKSRIETAASLGLRFDLVSNIPIDDGINAVRALLPRCRFDSRKCRRGIEALMNYSRNYNEERKAFERKPKHDWTSHAADAFRYAALSEDRTSYRPTPSRAETEFEVFQH